MFKSLDKESFLTLYKSLVRSIIDYGGSVYFPKTKKNIQLLENIQKCATKILPEFKDLTYMYTECLKRLNLPTLHYRTKKPPQKNQARKNVGPDLDPNSLTFWWYSWKNFFEKAVFEKIIRRQQDNHNLMQTILFVWGYDICWDFTIQVIKCTVYAFTFFQV